MFKVTLTEEGRNKFKELYKKMEQGGFDAEEDIQILSPLGLVGGEYDAGVIVTENKTMKEVIEKVKVMMDEEFDAGEDFDGSQLKEGWFRFEEYKQMII